MLIAYRQWSAPCLLYLQISMNDILVINDNTADMWQVTVFAYNIAAKLGRNIIMADTVKTAKTVVVKKHAEYAEEPMDAPMYKDENSLMLTLDAERNFKPRMDTLDASALNKRGLATYTYTNNISMIVQGVSGIRGKNYSFDPALLLSKICCPVLLVPEYYSGRVVNRAAYLADMRYCQTSILNYVDHLSERSVLLAHNCYDGLPDLNNDYANDLFNRVIVPKVRSSKLFFGYIRETNMGKIIDTLSNGVNIDLLACVNRQFHFNRLVGENFPALPGSLVIPLLVFPS